MMRPGFLFWYPKRHSLVALIDSGFAYLGLCVYAITKTSSTDELAAIGNAAIMSVIVGTLPRVP